MPKREKTPPPGPEEPTFLSIFNPWPPRVTLGYLDESKRCARWLACFIGKDNIYAMFHKPKSPNTIIIEISNELTKDKLRNILGEHDWDAVFPQYDPTEEGITHSQIFYSTFQSRREVEKTGWKPRLVTDDWFKGFNPTSGKIVNASYPATIYCEPPDLAETVNALQLFRPLPGDIFPEARRRPAMAEAAPTPPTAPPSVVPGSSRRAGSGGGNVNAAGGKGKKKAADPTVRPTAPVTRTAEASAKAKVTHSQPERITANAYDEDSDGDEGYENYSLHHPNTEEKPKGAKPGKEIKNLKKEVQKVHVNNHVEGYPTSQFSPDPFIQAGQEVVVPPEDICPYHRKPNCNPNMCEWASKKKREERQRQSRTGGRSGQNTRRW